MWFEGKWIQLELRNTNAACFLLYVEDRSKDKHIHKNRHEQM
jgi:hypothetical protein